MFFLLFQPKHGTVCQVPPTLPEEPPGISSSPTDEEDFHETDDDEINNENDVDESNGNLERKVVAEVEPMEVDRKDAEEPMEEDQKDAD